MFADDLNAHKSFPLRTPNEVLFLETDNCQTELHSWGHANQVSFEADKESKHVVSHKEAEGEDFKILGVKFDCELTMAAAVRQTVNEVSWKLRTLERTACYHKDAKLVDLYKAKVLSYLKYRTAAVYHATDTVLAFPEWSAG